MEIASVCHYVERILRFPVFCVDKNKNPVDDGRLHDEGVLDHLNSLTEADFHQLQERSACIHQAEDGAFWGGVTVGDRIYLLGPVGFDILRNSRKLYKTEYVSFVNAVLMIAEEASGTRTELLDFITQTEDYQKWDHALASRKARLIADGQENETIHNSYAQERREQQAIRDGNMERFERAINEPMLGDVGNIRVEDLRIYQDLALIVYTMATRSAIEGGLNCEEAFTLSDIFIEQVEQMDSPQDIYGYLRMSERDLVIRVANAKKQAQDNVIVEAAKKYILQHIRSDTSLQTIAEEIGVSKNYLSRLFAQCEGKGLKEYILESKIENACMLMTYTQQTLDEIAFYYGFSSASHFGRVFRKLKGITPAQYRKKVRLDNNIS